MRKNYLLYYLSVIVFLTYSCVRPNITPAYLIFCSEDFKDSVCVDVSNFNELHDTDYDAEELEILRQQTFPDVHVSINGHATGYWPLPCTIPVLPNYELINNIRIIPCVRIASNTLTTVQYHFLNPIEQNIFLEKEEKRKISSLKFDYRKEISIPFLETFVQSTDFSSLDTIHGAELELSVKDNKHCGTIILNDQQPYFNIATPYFFLTGQSVRQFWEISYMSKGGEMTAYLNFQNTVTGALIQDMVVFPDSRGVWKKGYIDITETIYLASGTASRLSVRLGIRGLRNASSQNADFHFESIKIITM